MSENTHTETVAPVKKLTEAARKKLTAAIGVVVDAQAAVVTAQASLGNARLKLGYAVLSAYSSLVKAGASDDDAQKEIMSTPGIGDVVKAGTKPDPVDWSTLRRWMQAAETNRSLPEDVREKFASVQPNEELRKVSDADARSDIASTLAGAGSTGAREVRDAVKEYRESASDDADADAVKAANLRARERMVKFASEKFTMPTWNAAARDKADARAELFVTLMMIGAGIGKKYPGQENNYRETFAEIVGSMKATVK